jgi:glycosyltransferase involved in cell wall biosynthesis
MVSKIVITANSSWYVYNFRSSLISMLRDQGHEIHIVAPPDDYCDRLKAVGCHYHPIEMNTQSTSLLTELRILRSFWRVYKTIKADLILSFTIKNNIYSSLIGRVLDLPVIPNISGLGQVFDRGALLRKLIVVLYRIAFHRSAIVFFQNEEDRTLFISNGLVCHENSERLPGSGVDLERFRQVPLPLARLAASPQPGKPCFWPARFILSARLIREKGVVEFAEALRSLRARGLPAHGILMGFIDLPGPSVIDRAAISEWESEGLMEFLGATDDVRTNIANADCVVLPSYYREGVPRSLLEAAAMGRPIITTDHPGCRDVVDNGENGYLVPPRNTQALSAAMAQILSLSPEERALMGTKSRKKIELEFAEDIVLKRYAKWVYVLLGARSRSRVMART